MLEPMPGYGSRYFDERTPASRRRARPVFKGERTADAVIIGGGLTGCLAANVFAHAGLDVVLLEAQRLAGGSTAGSLGTILPEPDASFRMVEAQCGVRIARTAWQEARRAAREFASLLKRQRIACDLESSQFAINARDADAAAELRREQTARKRAGLAASWTTAAGAEAELGTDTTGAIVAREAFTYDPVKAAVGLAARAEDAGAVIFERSAVRRTRFTRKDATVFTAGGRITTPMVYVATGEPGALFSQLRRHVTRREGYAVVTLPLSAAMRRETGRRSAVMTEAGPESRWLRWLSDGRALFAGAVAPPAPSRLRDRAIRQRSAQLMYELSVRYPVISGLPAGYGWDTPIVSTADGLPWIGVHRNYPFHFFAMAFGWHGDSLGWYSARAALRWLQGETTRQDEAFGFQR
jgi:gamma-glutamylputrescine oxidase